MQSQNTSEPPDAESSHRHTVVVAGASGFVGRHLCERLADDGHHVIALSRSGRAPVAHERVQGRRCDLFSMLDTERGVRGADQAVYLVHSMMPSARLNQASFVDMDAVLADNFATACDREGVAHIAYLGGLIPQGEVSAHLESRREVESILAGHGASVTVLRAGLVIGPHGSSFRIVSRLARRLPVMVCPSWTATPTQPVALADVVELFARLIANPDVHGEIYDIGAPEVLTYRQLLQRTAVIERERSPKTVAVPVITPRLSALWVSLITQTPLALVRPLVRSLEHPMVARDRRLQEILGVPGLSIDQSIKHAMVAEAAPQPKVSTVAPAPQPAAQVASDAASPVVSRPNDVRSIQRLSRPPEATAQWVADEYLRWLSKSMRHLIVVEVDEALDVARFRLRLTGTLLLELTQSRDRSTSERTILYLTGGRLLKEAGRGRFEFRTVDVVGRVFAAVHDFQPRLPWLIYRATQAKAHAWVMWRFGRHLERVARATSGV